jgi:hypothetical protein|tara:strand:- start:3297 stop:3923 length:627 start_codon:yes stop_codon:yes gene_type:complete
MDLKNRLRVALGLDVEVKMAIQETLEDGTIVVSAMDVLEAGADISILVEDGTTIKLAPGEYTLSDGRGFIVVDEGVISEMVEAVVEEVVNEPQTEEEVVEEVADEEVVLEKEEARQPKKVKSTKEYEFSQEDLVNVISKEVSTILDGYKSELVELSKKVEELSNAPSTNDMNLNKFSSNNYGEKLSSAQINKMSTRERIRYNLQNINK